MYILNCILCIIKYVVCEKYIFIYLFIFGILIIDSICSEKNVRF